jgi:hypothetical protein
MFRPFALLVAKDFYIIRLANLLTMSVPDEGSSRIGLRALNYISKVFGNK